MHSVEAGSGPPLLLLHGLFDSSQTWERLIPFLSGHFKVYAIDLPGFGKTPLSEDWPESLSGMVNAVEVFLNQHGIEKISLVGSSMGGALSLALAEKDPARFNQIAILNPYGLPNIPLAVKNAHRPLLGTLLPYLLITPAITLCAKSIFSRSLYDQTILTKERLERIVRPFASLARRKDLFRFLRMISEKEIKEIDALLPTVQKSVLILWGQKDCWLPNAHWQRLSKRLPRSTVKFISECGHLPQMEKPEEVADLLIPFFRQAQKRDKQNKKT